MRTGTLIHKGCGSVNDSCPQEMPWGGYGRNIFQNRTTPGSQLPKVNCPHTFYAGIRKRQTYPNLCHQARCSAFLIAAGMPIKRTMGNQIVTLKTGNVTSLQAINVEDSLGEKESLWAFGGNTSWQYSLEWKFSE